MAKKKLTDKQEMFCQEYLVDLNKTKAAERAGYSAKTAHSIGFENLIKPEIQDRIELLKQERIKKVEIKAQDVLQELLNWAYGDTTEFMQLSVEDVKKMPPEIRRLVTGFKIIEKKTKDYKDQEVIEEMVELKFISKEKAMEMITKHIGFNELDNMQQKKDDTPDVNITIDGKTMDLRIK